MGMNSFTATLEVTPKTIEACISEATPDITAEFETNVIYAKEPYYEVSNDKGTTIIIGG